MIAEPVLHYAQPNLDIVYVCVYLGLSKREGGSRGHYGEQ